jgi:hypothetical protein
LFSLFPTPPPPPPPPTPRLFFKYNSGPYFIKCMNFNSLVGGYYKLFTD